VSSCDKVRENNDITLLLVLSKTGARRLGKNYLINGKNLILVPIERFSVVLRHANHFSENNLNKKSRSTLNYFKN